VSAAVTENMRRLEAIVAELPEAERIDIEAWDDHPAFKVRKKGFVFADQAAESMSVKLSKDEAAAVVATDDSHTRRVRTRCSSNGPSARALPISRW
jgi:hypothetical protein